MPGMKNDERSVRRKDNRVVSVKKGSSEALRSISNSLTKDKEKVHII